MPWKYRSSQVIRSCNGDYRGILDPSEIKTGSLCIINYTLMRCLYCCMLSYWYCYFQLVISPTGLCSK